MSSARTISSLFLLQYMCAPINAETYYTDSAPTLDDIAELTKNVRYLIDTNRTDSGSTSGFPLLATTVRLLFHDCCGGCDGCININNEDNNGLLYAIQELEREYSTNFTTIMSRTDFWAAAGTVAWLYGVEISYGKNFDADSDYVPSMDYYWGRSDCGSVDAPFYNQSNPFPSPKANLSSTSSFFYEQFGFDEQETVTILGAHTLGKALGVNSKFHGKWTKNKDNFDHMFYVDLVNASIGWTQVDNTQWEHLCINGTQASGASAVNGSCIEHVQGHIGLMLNSDMTLYKELDLDADGFSSCGYDSCPLAASTASYVQQYAANNTLFLDQFAVVWMKMITSLPDGKSMQDLYLITNSSELPTTTGLPTTSTAMMTTTEEQTTPTSSPTASTEESKAAGTNQYVLWVAFWFFFCVCLTC